MQCHPVVYIRSFPVWFRDAAMCKTILRKMQKGMGNEWFHWLSMNNLGGSQGLDA
ncbi:hypothetical protein ABIE27_005850 [Paenibacillus sp. 4624]|jgi:hypothetical protein